MTSIKPPSSGTTGPHAVPERADGAGGSPQSDSAESSSFQRSLSEANQANQAPHIGGAAGSTSGSADPVGQLARAVESGSVSLDQAVDQLLNRTLEKAGKHLTGAQKAELSELLRGALLSDPTLASLRG